MTLKTAVTGAGARTSLRDRKIAVIMGSPSAVKLTLPAAVRTRVARALRRARTRTKVRMLVTATAVDAAGNASTKKLTVKVRR